MKKVVGLLLVLFTAAFLPAVSANEKPSIAIIDTAIDTSAVNVIHEVCLMEEKRCPNKQSYMEGPGAATLPLDQLYKNMFDHGTNMSAVAKIVSPDVNIVFIRMIPMTNKGTLGIYTDNTMNEALKWVIANKTKFNIVATSISFGSHNFKKTGPGYCSITRVGQDLRKNIITLQTMGVGTMFAAGNHYDKSRVDYPACISEAVAVGAVGERGNVENYSNSGAELDFYALGTYDVNGKRVMGTSPATAALAAFWAKNYKGSYQATYDYLKSVSKDLAVTVR
jgi:serine protease